MSSNEQREGLLHTIAAWRDAMNACEPGSPDYKKYQSEMKKAEWELHRLGATQNAPGLEIKIVDPNKPKG